MRQSCYNHLKKYEGQNTNNANQEALTKEVLEKNSGDSRTPETLSDFISNFSKVDSQKQQTKNLKRCRYLFLENRSCIEIFWVLTAQSDITNKAYILSISVENSLNKN